MKIGSGFVSQYNTNLHPVLMAMSDTEYMPNKYSLKQMHEWKKKEESKQAS